MRLEDTLILLLQGVSQQAIARNPDLNHHYEAQVGKTVRIRFHNPYLNVYLTFTPEALLFSALYEGDVDQIYDIDTQPFLKALYVPASWHGHQLEGLICETKGQDSSLTAFLILLCQNWDFWNLLQLICSELMPWMNSSKVSLEDLYRVKRLLDQRLLVLEEQNETFFRQQNQMHSLIKSLEKQVGMQNKMILILGVMTGLTLVLSLWSHLIA